MPGFPGDPSLAGKSSPIFGSEKCGDPTVAWDTSGHAFLLGLAQHPNGTNFLFVARFTDPDDGQGKLEYNFTRLLASGNPSSTGQDLDKPSILFVPDPTPGSKPDAGFLHACGTIFNGTQGGKFRNKVLCALSSDGGKTYSLLNQGKVNGTINTNNGTAIAPSYIPVGGGKYAPDGGVYVFWRAFLGDENGYWFVKIDRSGNATKPSRAIGGAGFYPYDVPTLSQLARSNAFPTVATDATGRILLAFQAYSDSSGRMGPPSFANTPRIFLTYSTDGGGRWERPFAVDYGPLPTSANPGGTAFQFMPRMAVSGGGAFEILYYDARSENRPINCFTSGQCFPVGRDRRYDVRVVQGQFVNGSPQFTLPSQQVSKYITSSTTGQVLDRPGCPSGSSCPAVLMPNLPIAGGGTLTCSATNGAGLDNSVSVIIQIDTTPPVIVPSVTGTLGQNGWYVSDVTVSWSVTDPESGIASKSGCDTTTHTSDTTGTTLTCTATNGVGLSTSVSVTIKIDKTPPNITITTPANNGTYLLNASVASSYSCLDPTPGSGLASCSGPVSNGSNFSTNTVASNPVSFTVTAADNAGNNATRTNTYFVVYNFVLEPPKSPAELGSAVPLNWQLKDANGQFITDLGSLVSLWSVYNGPKGAAACTPSRTGIQATLYSPATGATGGSDLRSIASTNSFKFNWNTSTAVSTGTGCYTIVFQLKDNAGPDYAILNESRLKLTTVELK